MKTLRRLILATVMTLPFCVDGQMRNCATNEWTSEFRKEPNYFRLVEQLKKPAQWKSSNNSNQQTRFVTDTIAVVVHVLYSNAAQNIPDSVIFRQIAILNEDFPRLNSDSVNTPAPFAAIAGRANFRFQLARRDDNGAITNGIVRWPTTHGPFSSFFDLIQTSAGGHDSWGGSYLNIYCVDIDPSTGAAGIAFAGSNLCMIDYQEFGLNDLLSVGRVCTHEVGHCFGLLHIWGSEPQQGPFDCNDDDNIADTPPQFMPGSICGSFPKYDSCTTSGNGVMYMNYMDYTFGTCRNMFSEGQMTYMNNHIATSLPDILNSTGLIPVPDYDAGCVSILEPNGSACGTVNPVVVIRNWGAQSLTSLTIYFSADGGTVDSAGWTGNLSNYETDTVNLAQLNLPSGAHLLTVYTGLPNGNADAEPANDSAYVSFTSGNSISVPVLEGFENTFPPAGWTFSSPDSAFGFRLNTTVANLGNNSIDFYGRLNSTYTGEIIAGLQTSFSNITNPILSFDYAHTYASCCGSLDTLDILISDDCGQSYIVASNLSGSNISTAPVVAINTNLFVPMANEWKNKTIDLSAYAGSQDVIIKFRLVNMWGLQFYLDNVNITGTNVSVIEPERNYLSIYPNPGNGHFYLDGKNENVKVDVLQSDGRIIYRNNFTQMPAEINLNAASGIYFLRVSDAKDIWNYKIVIE